MEGVEEMKAIEEAIEKLDCRDYLNTGSPDYGTIALLVALNEIAEQLSATNENLKNINRGLSKAK